LVCMSRVSFGAAPATADPDNSTAHATPKSPQTADFLRLIPL
jgi:hypothetical protein